jgi:UDP-galactopyranose mutase
MRYDYLIVGTGLFGATFAAAMREAGKKCLCIDKRDHIGGNIYTEKERGISVHKYGAHIFHTSNREVWEYVNRYAEFNGYVNSPVAVYRDELYNLPFNMNTFSKMWGIKTPAEAKAIIEQQKEEAKALLGGAAGEEREPANLEEQALSLIGRDVYEKLIKGYTEKQWGRSCTDLPAFIIRRLPVRFTYDNNYFTDKYQGIPVGGYTQIIEKLLEGTPVKLGVTYQDFVRESGASVPGKYAVNCSGEAECTDRGDVFDKVLYTGMIDEYFDYVLGELQYRSLRFETQVLEGCDNFQGNAVVNYTEREVPYTRIIEHKHFEYGTQPDTIITREYPATWQRGDEPYYPVNDERNSALYAAYAQLAEQEKNVLFGGRLGQYKYYDMDKVIAEALQMAEAEKTR